MKKRILLLAAVMISATGYAQTTVKLKINHKLADAVFAMSQEAQNDLGVKFNVTRLEYYISGLSIVHDGGQISDASDVYILANAGTNETWDLGMHSVTNVEGINFSIGVDPGVNNQDPTQWPGDHALAPKSPSMHWGWTAGYRFVAMEGYAGSGLSNNYQLHGLGNDNYFNINIPTGAADDNGDLLIELNADYTKALSGIDISGGVVVHGDFGEAQIVLRNFNNYVFTSLNGDGNTLSFKDNVVENAFLVFPNPAASSVHFILDDPRFEDASISISDMMGRSILSDVTLEEIDHHTVLNVSGVYFATLVNREGLRSTQKIVIQ